MLCIRHARSLVPNPVEDRVWALQLCQPHASPVRTEEAVSNFWMAPLKRYHLKEMLVDINRHVRSPMRKRTLEAKETVFKDIEK